MENTISIIAISLSVISLFISIRTFLYDRTIKKDAIKKIKEEENERKKANLFCSYSKNGALGIIQISNKGNVIAQNLIISISKEFQLHNEDIIQNPINLNGESSVEIKIILYTDSPSKILITLNWDDEYMKGNKKTIELSRI